MTANSDSTNPKLRLLDLRPIVYEGQPYIYLRDPLALSDKTIILPQSLAPLLMFLDGTRDASAMSASLAIRFGIRFPAQKIEELISILDNTYLLENDAYLTARQKKLDSYRQMPFRRSCCAGQTFPAEKEALLNLLDGWMSEAADENYVLPQLSITSPLIGVISPHIDYERGHKTYAALWKNIAPYIRDIDLAIIFGTDHYSQHAILTLTRQKYATPFGVLPNDEELIQLIADTIGEEEAFAEELHHAGEHSVELALTWLHYIKQKQPEALPFKVLPILCGDLLHSDEEANQQVERFCTALRSAIQGRKTLVIAAADLSHVGPAFGGEPIDIFKQALVKEADAILLALIREGKPEEFLQAVKSIDNKYNVCGVTPIYFTLKVTQSMAGTLIAHEFCPADEHHSSWVSICGFTLEGNL